MKPTYTFLTNKFWTDLVYQLRLENVGAVTASLGKLPKTQHNYWVLVDALDMAKSCVARYKANPKTYYKLLTPANGRAKRKGFDVSQYRFELLVIAIEDEIQNRN